MSRCKTDNQPSDVRNRRTAGAAAHLDKEEAGCRGRVMVDVDCDQHACNHDKHHQQDAQDQTSVKRMSAFHPVYSTVSWHHWKTQQEAIMLAHTHSVCYFRLLSTAGLIITLCHMQVLYFLWFRCSFVVDQQGTLIIHQYAPFLLVPICLSSAFAPCHHCGKKAFHFKT